MHSVFKSHFSKYIAAIIAGLLIVLSLAPYKLWPLALLSVALQFWIVESLKQRKRQFFSILLYHFALFGFGASWVYVSIHDYGYTSEPLAILLTTLFCASLAVANSLCFLVYLLLRNSKLVFSIGNLLLFASVATLTELARSVMLSGFPWLLIGYSQTETAFNGLATVFGVYGLSLLTFLSGAMIICVIKTQQQYRKPIRLMFIASVASLWIAAAALGEINWTEQTGKTRSTSMVQANISQHQKWDRKFLNSTLNLYKDLTEKELQSGHLTIWPEAAIPMYQDHAQDFLNQLSYKANNANSAILIGIPTRESQDNSFIARNSLVAIGKANGAYHKRHLVPFGEYVPFQSFFGSLMRVFNLPLSSMRAGSDTQAPLKIFDWQSLPLICYEIVFPSMTAKAAKQSDVLITVSNDSWFGQSIGPIQHLQMAQMRALENGRYLLRSTGSGVTAIIQSDGTVAKTVPQFEQAVLQGEYHLMQGYTPWTKFGYWLIHLVSVILLIPALAIRLRKD